MKLFYEKIMLEFIKKVLEENISEEQKIDFLRSLENKNISAIELAEIVKYFKSKQEIKLDLPYSIDMCWTWWSWLERINTSTLACLKLAASWVKVAKHWNNASSWRFGSFDLIEKLGLKIPKSLPEILEEYEKNNVAFLYAKLFFPFMAKFANARKVYGKPTIFNILWPLLNPADSDFQIIWCSFEDKMELITQTCKILWRKNVLVVRWEDWLDEITLSWETKVFELRSGIIKQYFITPEDFQFQTCKKEDILASSNEEKFEIAKKIIAQKNAWKYSDLVDLNVEVALKFIKK